MRHTHDVAEDWRITVTTADGASGRLLRALHEREVRDELRDELGGRVAVSSDGPNVFLYADTRRAADAAERVLRDVLAEHRLTGEPRLERWHPIEERWEPPEVPLPETAAEREVEHDRREEQEREESLRTGVAQWEVRVELPTHAEASSLAEELERAGQRVVRRSHYLLVGANDEEEATALAERLQREAPRGVAVHVEPGSGLAWQLLPTNPFAVFGGLGG